MNPRSLAGAALGVGAALLLTLLGWPAAASAEEASCPHHPTGAAAAPAKAPKLDGRSLYHSKVEWTSQAGKRTTLADLGGRPLVVAMLYTRCRTSCPLTMGDLRAIEAALPEKVRKEVRFAVFSFDDREDRPERLRAFAIKEGVDLARWGFYHGDAGAVLELAALLGVRYKRLDDGEFDHSNVITIVDDKGLIVHRQLGVRSDPATSVAALTRLAAAK